VDLAGQSLAHQTAAERVMGTVVNEPNRLDRVEEYSMAWTLEKYLLVVAILLLGLMGCGNEEFGASRDQIADTTQYPDSHMHGATYFTYDRGRETTKILAEEMLKYEEIDSIIAYVVEVDVYDSLGQVTSELTGDSAIIRELTGAMHIYGHVVLIRGDGIRLDTEYLFYDSKSDSLHTPAYVEITRGEDIYRGMGLDSDPGLKHFRLRETSGVIKNLEEFDKGF
jgi:LPS export ABC transporter protein LptC